MNQEKFSMPFPGQKKKEEDAHRINEAVDEYYKKPRTNKNRSADDVAHEIIKEEKHDRINLAQLSKEEKMWYENMKSAGVRILSDGFLEISRWDNTGKHAGNPVLIRQKVDGINSAIRMQDHILENYRFDKKEKPSVFSQIESIQEVIEHANELLNKWSKTKSEDKETMQMQLAHVILQLENCRNEFMVGTKDQAEAIIDLKDSLGRENPGAFAARTVAALNNLAKRINEMQLIMPSIAMRKESLVLEKRRIDGARRKSAGHLLTVLKHSVFNDNPKKSPDSRVNPNEVVEMNKKLGQALYLLDLIHTAPYFQQADQAKFQIFNKTKEYFSSKSNLIANLPLAKEGLEKSLEILESDMEKFD